MSPLFNPLSHPILFATPRRLTPFSTWHEHIPFAMFLVDLLRPTMIVELGTHYGDSYCAFCQAVKELNLATRCYAIDTWKGDPDAGFYGPEVLEDLRAHHDPLYGSYSRLIQSTFDEAVEHFTDGTIDILHIDGFHAYEAVRHDFESWLPKLSSHGVVLFHDINVRERDFGVRTVWEEVRLRYPHFEFLHGHGLGVLAVGKEQPETFRAILEASPANVVGTRNFFSLLGQRVRQQVESAAARQALDAKAAELAAVRQAHDGLQAELERARQEIAGKDEELAAARRGHDGLQAELERARQEIAGKDEELAAARRGHDGLQAELERVRQEIAGKDGELAAARRVHEGLQAELERAQSKASLAARQCAGLDHRIALAKTPAGWMELGLRIFLGPDSYAYKKIRWVYRRARGIPVDSPPAFSDPREGEPLLPDAEVRDERTGGRR